MPPISLWNIILVIIKGTQVYDSSKGKFVDLSVLDVLQVFGRAGRPGMETSGEGYICTTDDKLTHYLDAVTSQVRGFYCRDEWTGTDSYYLLTVDSNRISVSIMYTNMITFNLEF